MTQQLTAHRAERTLFDLTAATWSAGQGGLRLKVPVQLMTRPMPAPKRERTRARSATDLAKAAAKAGVEIIAPDGTIFRPSPAIAPIDDDATVIKTADELRKLI